MEAQAKPPPQLGLQPQTAVGTREEQAAAAAAAAEHGSRLLHLGLFKPIEMARPAAVLAVVALAILLATAQARKVISYTHEDLASEDSMWALYERWVAHHKELVRDHGEMTRRFPIFKNNLLRIASIVGDPRGEEYRINVFGDRTFEELKKYTSCCC